MFINYFKTAWRNLWKNRFYSFINISGLAIGLAVGILILLWVQDEYSYDNFHSNANSIYKINSHIGSGASAQVWSGVPGGLAAISKQVPNVKSTTRINEVGDEQVLFRYGNKKFEESHLAFVENNFFSFFTFPLLQGNKNAPFPNNNSILITQSEAKKYFGNDSPVGKVLSTADYGMFTVSGVMADFPSNSSMHYDMLLPMGLYADMFTEQGGNGKWKTIDEDLGNYGFTMYLQTAPGASADAISHILSQLFREKKSGQSNKDDFFSLQPLSSLHLVGRDGNNNALQMVRIFLVIAILILVIACINYVNLSTARAMLRAKEVSVRKIIGAGKHQLFIQFIVESAVLFVFASLLSFVIIYWLLPVYNEISGKQLVFDIRDADVWLVILSTVGGALILASVYPALLLSAFKPIEALKGKLSFGLRALSFRRVLVISQFVISVVLITGTVVITKQLEYIREKDLGYDREQVFSFNLSKAAVQQYDAARNELEKQPGIVSVATASNNFVGVSNTTGDVDWDGKPDGNTFLIHASYIDEKLIPLLRMKIGAGRNFSQWPADSAHYILNEAAVRKTGIQNPVGKRFQMWKTNGTIIGVVKDFNYASLKEAVEPAVFLYNPFNWTVLVKTTGASASQAIASAQKVWKKYDADTPFQYSFLDDDYNRLYKAEEKAGILIRSFAAIAILLSCLGLFGLITFTAQVKTKEIGIRKVLGANLLNITILLGREFIALVTVAFLIASPVAWLAMNKWLQDFAYRIPLQGWMFLLSGVAIISISVVTISFQTIKAALANPVKSLRTE